MSGNIADGNILANNPQGVRPGGAGITFLSSGIIEVNSQTVVGVMKLGQTAGSAAAAYNGYTWPIGPGSPGQQLTTDGAGLLSWANPNASPYTAKGQLVVGTGVATDTLLNVGTDTSFLVADSGTTSGLVYTNNVKTAALLPAGNDTTDRPATPVVGQIRYNSTANTFEGYGGAVPAWAPIGATINPASLAEAAAGIITTKYSSPETAVPKDASGMTGAAILPAGTSVQQPATPVDGMFRFNTTTDAFEGYGQNLTSWEPLMPTGAATDKTVYLNNQTITANYTIPTAPIIKNGLSAGPITINAGVTVTIPAGQAWSIV